MDIQILQKFQIKNERGTLKNCQICGTQFGVFTREHQCKRCFRGICSNCGQTKRQVYKPNMNRRPHRICDICKPESDFQAQFIGVNKLIFGKDSQIALKWCKKLPQIQQPDLHQSSSKKQYRKFTIEIFNELWNAYNYSLRQFIGLMTYNMNQNQVYQIISKVYIQLQTTGMEEKIQNIICLIALILCFSSPETAVLLIKFLYNLRKTITEGKHLLIQYLKALNFVEDETRKLSDYINYKLKQFISCFSVNLIPVQSSIHVLTRVLEKKKIDELFMFFSLLLGQTKQVLLENKNNKTANDLILIRNCKLNNIIQKYKLLAGVKSSLYIRSNTSNIKPREELKITHTISREDETHSQMNISDSKKSLMLNGNFKKKTTMERVEEDESFSIKTMSMNEEEDEFEQKTSPRRIQKQKNPSFIKIETKQNLRNFECERCREKNVRMKELEELIHKKNNQIERLTIEGQSSMDTSMQKEENPKSQQLKFKIHELQQEMLKKIQANDALFRDLTKQQKQNNNMKTQLEELQVNNKMLKNKIESSSLYGTGNIRSSEKEEQALKVNEIMKKTLIEKNKQIEQLMKKNKLLSFQLQDKNPKIQTQVPLSIREMKSQEKKQEQLMEKISEMSQLLVKEEAEKLQLSKQLFQVRERANTMPVVTNDSKDRKSQKKEQQGNCIIF